MMKGFLILLIFSCCAWGGVHLCFMMRRRALVLSDMAASMGRLENRINQQKCTLREALEQLTATEKATAGKKMAERMLTIWQMSGSMAENWADTAQNLCREDADFRLLNEEEKLWLALLILDQADFSLQTEVSQAQWVLCWKNSAEEAQKRYQTQGILWSKLGLMVGLALAILML